MPSNLSEQQINQLKGQLQLRYEALREEVREELLQSDNEQYIELAGRVHDAEEQSVADLLADLDLAFIDLHIEEIRSIEAALMRMAAGTYGVCVTCANDIGYERLHAMPSANRCRDCQALHEKTYAEKGRPTL